VFQGGKRIEDLGENSFENGTEAKSWNIHAANGNSGLGKPFVKKCIEE